MNKADKILALVLIFGSLLGYVPLAWKMFGGSTKAESAVVYYRDQEILRVSLQEDSVYEVKGTNGTVTLEVEDGRIRVEKENSPYHYCSIQGWVDSSAEPIVCLPNDIVILIEDTGDSDVDTVIQ